MTSELSQIQRIVRRSFEDALRGAGIEATPDQIEAASNNLAATLSSTINLLRDGESLESVLALLEAP